MDLAQLLHRHADIRLVEHTPGRPALIRRDDLLVPGADADRAERALGRWTARRGGTAGVGRLTLRPAAKVDVCELADTLGYGRPNHVLFGQPLWWGGPADRPEPAAPLPAPRPSASARRITVALPDTGIADHPWYSGADWFLEQDRDAVEVLDADRDEILDSQAGHGTFIAGLILRQAPSARLLACRILGSDGVGDELGLIRGLDYLRGRRIDLINLSLGGYTYDDRPSPLVLDSLGAFPDSVVVACAGNGGDRRPFWPAALPGVVGVAALDAAENARAPYAGHGPWVDACSRGDRLTSTFVTFGSHRGYATWSGSSFASAVVAGAIAACGERHGLPIGEARDRILAGDRRIPDLGVLVPTPR
ncbi:S8 family peptidase [Rhizohabitans arisaemae]|uniref:S8 family peptidase n=1 Tax=Rhizohabitans arisaemae TaxID=2720610 RepID=UPI0024B16B2D|nr:S8/S53 family peptidase [Rhizohabitans arisaemae]